MDGGAWPFLVGEAICLVDSDNERDSYVLISRRIVSPRGALIRRRAFGRGRPFFGISSRVASFPGVFSSCRRGRSGSKRRFRGRIRWRPTRPARGGGAQRGGVRRVQIFLEVSAVSSCKKKSDNRSVMPLDVLGRTRATM